MSEQKIYSPPALDTTAQRIASALESRNSEMGALSGLTTDAKTSLAAAINEVDGHADTNATNITETNEKVYILIQNGNWRTGIREKNLGTSFTSEQKAAIAAGDFTDFWNGDYWYINSIRFRVVDNRNFQYNRGDTNFTTPGLVIFPDSNLIASEAYLIDGGTSSSNTDTHGYGNCGYRTDEKSGKGRTACRTIFANAFGSDHIATHRELMSNARGTGGATGWAWFDADVELPSIFNSASVGQILIQVFPSFTSILLPSLSAYTV